MSISLDSEEGTGRKIPWGWIGLGIAVVGLLVLISVGKTIFNNYQTTYDRQNELLQRANKGKSQVSVAINMGSQKIEAVWAMVQQFYDASSKAQKDIAQARSGFFQAKDAYDKLAKDNTGNQTRAQTEAANKALTAAMAFQFYVMHEAPPDLHFDKLAEDNIRTADESISQIKTAIDDFVTNVEAYNTYSGRFWVAKVYGKFTGFPASLEYYKGPIGELDVSKLNPVKAGKTGNEAPAPATDQPKH